jgi:hypothetical protein
MEINTKFGEINLEKLPNLYESESITTSLQSPTTKESKVIKDEILYFSINQESK